MLRRTLLVVVGLGSCLLRGEPAAACDPVPLESAEQPAAGATEMPLDTLIVVRSSATPPAITVASSGVAVTVDSVDVPGLTGARAFRPRSPLPANEEIVVGAGGIERRFRTGAAQTVAASAWEIVGSRYEVEASGACAWNSCAGLETLFVDLKPRAAGAVPLFSLFHAGPAGKVDLERPALAFMNTNYPSENGNRHLVIHTTASIRKGDRLFVVPVSPSGALGEPLGPVGVEDESGCTIASSEKVPSRLPLLMLLLVAVALRALRLRRSRPRPGT
jgi:hypothetical protein